MQYRICPDCGAHLDPQEKCDCRDEKSGPLTAMRKAACKCSHR